MNRDGHYHIEFETTDDDELDEDGCFEGQFVNEKDPEAAKAAIYNNQRPIKDAHFVCTFGCGRPHVLIDDDYAKLGIDKELKRVSINASCEKCGTEALVKRGTEVDCPNPECGRTISVCECGGEYCFSNYCGVRVCNDCDDHKGLARCYCGWSKSGGNGRTELEDMGETIEPDDGSFFNE